MVTKEERDKLMKHFLEHYDFKYFKQTIQKLAREKNVTQKQLAKMVQISPGTFTRYFNGSLNPSLNVVIRLSYVLQVPVESLYNPEYSDDGVDEESESEDYHEIMAKKVDEQYDKYKALIEYLKSVGCRVSPDYGNACWLVCTPQDWKEKNPCVMDDTFAEKMQLSTVCAVFDWIHTQKMGINE